MKKLLTIFSVIMAICIADSCWAEGNGCPIVAEEDHNANEDIMIGSINGSGAQFFHCKKKDCGEGTRIAVVGTYYYDGYERSHSGKYLTAYEYRCDVNGVGAYSWEDSDVNISWCADSDSVRPDNTWDMTTVELCAKDRKGGSVVNTGVSSNGGWGVVVPSGGCYDWYCKAPLVKDSSGKCVADTTDAKNICENAPSYGQWQNNTCKCNKEGQKDKDPGKTCECQAGLEFDAGQDMCINPNQSEIEKCKKSGGEWDDRDPNNQKCTCFTVKGFDETPINGKCVCADAPNKQYDDSADACVATEQAICTNSGGDWDGTSCTCDTKKHLKEVRGVTPTRCECEDDKRYEYWPDRTKGCKLNAQAQREENNFEVLQNDCDKSGGKWHGDITNPNSWECVCDAAKGLHAENNVCVCLNEMYQRSASNPKKCELTDIAMAKNNCTDARDNNDENVTWIDAGKNSYCKCLDSSKHYDYATKKCISSVEQWCNKISGAHMMHGKCVCKATGNAPVNGRCPTGTSGGANTPGTQQNTTTTKDNIKTKYNALADISGKWGKSHWKTASGNFNGARLASDSVAGVVLGTVGGVITSNVIKKNQVRGGFEDLRCVIGGQTVADWGDQFMVGVQ